jgi:hypothetical protein
LVWDTIFVLLNSVTNDLKQGKIANNVLVVSLPFITTFVAFHFPMKEASLNPQLDVASSLPQDKRIAKLIKIILNFFIIFNFYILYK